MILLYMKSFCPPLEYMTENGQRKPDDGGKPGGSHGEFYHHVGENRLSCWISEEDILMVPVAIISSKLVHMIIMQKFCDIRISEHHSTRSLDGHHVGSKTVGHFLGIPPEEWIINKSVHDSFTTNICKVLVKFVLQNFPDIVFKNTAGVIITNCHNYGQ